MKISDCQVIEGNLYQIMGEDEMLTCYPVGIMAVGVDGEEYVHHVNFPGHYVDTDSIARPCMTISRNNAQVMVNKIKRRGAIDLRHWTKQVPFPLEERLEPFGYEYNLERWERQVFN